MSAPAKVILILVDGLRRDTAYTALGGFEHLVERGAASRFDLWGELPGVSRPMYETIHTGVPPVRHGIASNAVVRPSNQSNLFALASAAGLVTAAAAYFWFAELYNRCPYDAVADREVNDPALPIQHGRFYTTDAFPDEELFALGAHLVHTYRPDFTLIHPMGMDDLGHRFGPASSEYQSHAVAVDQFIQSYLPAWLAAGFTVVLTSDHGIDEHRGHGGNAPALRELPLYTVTPGLRGRGAVPGVVSQLSLAPTLCRLLGLSVPAAMQAPPLDL